MFKVKLVENPLYYRLVRLQSLFLFLMFLSYIGLVVTMKLAIWSMALSFLAFLVAIFLLFRNKNAIHLLIGRKLLEIEGDHIMVLDFRNRKISELDIHMVDSIATNKEYNLMNYKFPEILNSWKGNPPQNYIEFNQEGEKTHLEFYLDSDYESNH